MVTWMVYTCIHYCNMVLQKVVTKVNMLVCNAMKDLHRNFHPKTQTEQPPLEGNVCRCRLEERKDVERVVNMTFIEEYVIIYRKCGHRCGYILGKHLHHWICDEIVQTKRDMADMKVHPYRGTIHVMRIGIFWVRKPIHPFPSTSSPKNDHASQSPISLETSPSSAHRLHFRTQVPR